MIFALTLGIVCFSAGCAQSSQWHIGTRVLILAPLLLMASLLLKVLWWPWPWMNAVNICYGLSSGAIGALAYRRIIRGRFRITVGFVLGYLVGIALGPLGVVTGAALGAIIARRSLKKLEVGKSSLSE